MGKRIEAGELIELRYSRLCIALTVGGKQYGMVSRGRGSYSERLIERGTKALVTGREWNDAWGLMVKFILPETGDEYAVYSGWVRRVKEQ